MSKGVRIAFRVAAGSALIAIAFALALVVVLRSDWFANFVRIRTVAAIERTTGGRVELKRFHFEWSTLAADFDNLIVRGSEPPTAPPLFQTPHIRIVFPMSALLRRQVIISSIDLDRARIYFLVRPDGTTNFPHIRNDSIDLSDLLSLRIGHFALRNGVFQTDLQSISLEAQGKDLSVLLRYARRPARYQIEAGCEELHFESTATGFKPVTGGFALRMALEKDQVAIDSAIIRAADSTLTAHGHIRRFADPIVDLDITAQSPAAEAANFAHMTNLSGGRIDLSGTVHYDTLQSVTFAGHVTGEHLTYRFPLATLVGGTLSGDLKASKSGAVFSNLRYQTAEGSLSGTAAVANWRALAVNASVSRADIQRLFTLFAHEPLPWSGIGDGHVSVNTDLEGRNFVSDVQLNVVKGTGANPVSGTVSTKYRRQGQVLTVQAELASANTKLSLSGTLGDLVQVHLQTSAGQELEPILEASGHSLKGENIDINNSQIKYDGEVRGPLQSPQVSGEVSMQNFGAAGQRWDEVKARFTASPSKISVTPASFVRQGSRVLVNGSAELSDWEIRPESRVALEATLKGFDIRNSAAPYANLNLPVFSGIASGHVRVSGPLEDPSGSGTVTVVSVNAFDQRLNQVQAVFTASGDELQLRSGTIQAGSASIAFAGSYKHQHRDWAHGVLRLHLDSNEFPLNSFSAAARLMPDVSGRVEIHGDTALKIAGTDIRPEETNGRAALSNIKFRNIPYGDLRLTAATEHDLIHGTVGGSIRQNPVSGSFAVGISSGNPVHAEISATHVDIRTLTALMNTGTPRIDPSGFVSGALQLDGSMSQLPKVHGRLTLNHVELQPVASAAEFQIRNDGPVVVNFGDGVAKIQSLQLSTREGRLGIAGSFGYLGERPLDLTVKGKISLASMELLDANMTASGSGSIEASIRGPLSTNLSHLLVDGDLSVNDGSFYLKGVTNGLTGVNGRIRFERDRATIEKLTGESGGGRVEMGGFLRFGEGRLVYDLKARGDSVRVRYGGAVSVTTDAALQMTGTTENGLISGSVTASRIVINPDTDIGGILALSAARGVQPVKANDLLSGLQLDVTIKSSPNLEVVAAQSRDIEAGMDLRLRGTPGNPILLGTISADQGEIRVFGARYSLNSGEVTFSNATRIEPVLNLDVQTVTRGVTVDITLSGTPNNLNINYRSDPPLQTRDIIALLTVGQPPGFAPSSTNAQPIRNDVSALQAGANTVLGQAISPGANRLSKLFGITNIKIDPLAQGLTNTPQSRLTIEQQISQNVTVTYVTNLAQTSEQIFRFEWALNPQYSIVAIRDDNGEFGIDIQYKKRFK